MSREKSLDVQGIIDRAKQVLGISTDIELANLLGIKQNTVSSWKRRGNIDLVSIIKLCANVSTDWLIHGIGSAECGMETDRTTRMINTLLKDMDEEEKRSVLKNLEKDKFITEMMEKYKCA